MSTLDKIRAASKIFRKDGIRGIAFVLKARYNFPLPMSRRSIWEVGVRSQVDFWDSYLATGGLRWADTYKSKSDDDRSLQTQIASLLPPRTEVQILDVGAGPLTFLGKKAEGKRIRITAVDPLGDEFDRLLDKYGIEPLVRTQKLAAEELSDAFPANTFDLVVARNSIDHAYDPERAILQMIHVVKPGHYVYLEHTENEARRQRYAGFHQWNFFMDPEGDFMINSRSTTVDITRKYADLCTITCEIETRGDVNIVITKIKEHCLVAETLA